MADRLTIGASSRYKDVVVSVSSDIAQDFWRKRNAVSNFLKHADRDAKSHISLDDVVNLWLLTQASGSYLHLTDDNLGVEGFVLWVYGNAVRGMKEGMPRKFRGFASNIEKLEPGEQIRFCSKWLREMKEASTAAD